MAFVQGERFHLDLDTADDETDAVNPNLAFDFIGKIKERPPSHSTPPTAPSPRDTKSGFPAHKKRSQASAFKQQRSGKHHLEGKDADSYLANVNTQRLPASSNEAGSWNDNERDQIDQENRQKLDEMTPEEIARERQELFSVLNPSLIQKLLHRASIDDETHPYPVEPKLVPAHDDIEKPHSQKDERKVRFSDSLDASLSASKTSEQDGKSQDVIEPPPAPSEAEKALLEKSVPPSGSIHFPRSPAAPELDPNSPNFLNDLHAKYFPDLPHDPAKISWMTGGSNSNATSAYHPSQQAFEASDVRFNFRGELIPPSLAQKIPVTEGLHHHGDAPNAAGYTIPELARLSRSAVPAQRCIAIQTIGRILYRLGIGEFGDETQREDAEVRVARLVTDQGYEDRDDSSASQLAKGLWTCVEEGRVIETLEEEAGKEKGHLTSITLAQEALWNWQRGGGRKRRAI